MPTSEQLSAAAELRASALTFQRLMPASSALTAFLQSVGRVAFALEHGERLVGCKRCGVVFGYLEAHWSVPPRHCGRCRAARKEEKQRAIDAGIVVPEKY